MTQQERFVVRALPNQMIDPVCGSEPLGRKILIRCTEVEQYRFTSESFAPAFEISNFLNRPLDESIRITRSRLKFLRMNVQMKFGRLPDEAIQ